MDRASLRRWVEAYERAWRAPGTDAVAALFAEDATYRSGALVDGRGRVVGVNTAVAGVGLGLAVPIDAVTRKVIGSLMTEGRVRRAYLGIAGGERPLPPGARARWGADAGLEVVEVVEGSPAARAGVRAEDLIVEVDGTRVTSVSDLQRLMVAELIGAAVVVTLLRDGRALSLELMPAELTMKGSE